MVWKLLARGRRGCKPTSTPQAPISPAKANSVTAQSSLSRNMRPAPLEICRSVQLPASHAVRHRLEGVARDLPQRDNHRSPMRLQRSEQFKKLHSIEMKNPIERLIRIGFRNVLLFHQRAKYAPAKPGSSYIPDHQIRQDDVAAVRCRRGNQDGSTLDGFLPVQLDRERLVSDLLRQRKTKGSGGRACE